MNQTNQLVDYSLDNNSNIIELNENDIIKLDELFAGLIYVKKRNIWKKKYFVLGDNFFDYWKSNKVTNKGRKRIKEKNIKLTYKCELSCIKSIVYNDKIAWSFNIYKNDNFLISLLSYNQKINDMYEKMRKRIYFYHD
tara:strand:+ start:76 stop:489 length:414 start_codon:yes stop_codon:yes gene_type:complete